MVRPAARDLTAQRSINCNRSIFYYTVSAALRWHCGRLIIARTLIIGFEHKKRHIID